MQDLARRVPEGTGQDRTPTGRTGELARIAAVLSGHRVRGVVLAGGAGVGRTRLAEAAVRPYARVVRVTGTRSGAAFPLGAFAPLLPPGTTALGEALATLDLRGRVLLADDAHLLDRASAALLHHLAARRAVRLVVTVREGEPAPDAVAALWKDDLLTPVHVPPLGEPEIAELLTARLGGPVERRTVRRLSAMTGGDLRLLRELVDAGSLTACEGVSGLRGAPVITARIRELVSYRLGDLDPAEWETLTCLAFGARPADLTAQTATLERLESRGLLTPAGTVRYAEIVRAMTGPLRSARLRATFSAALDSVHAPAPAMPPPPSAAQDPDAGGRRPGREPQTPPPAPAKPGERGEPGAPPSALAKAGERGELGAPPSALAKAGERGELGAPPSALAKQGERGESGASPPVSVGAGERGELEWEQGRFHAALLAADLGVTPDGEDAERDEAAALYRAQRARLALLAGRPVTAAAWARDGLWRLDGVAGPCAALCLGELAQAAALTGDLVTAREAYGRALAMPDPFGAAASALPWITAAAGDPRAGAEQALRLVDGAADPSASRVEGAAHLASRVFAWHTALRLGADRLPGAPGTAAPLAALFGRHAAALGDPAALEAVAAEFRAAGLTLCAAEAYAQAAQAYGDDRGAGAARAAGWALARRCEGARTPPLAFLAAPGLTPRQLEIARLAAAGLSNRAIAEHLTVSIRTVANHLCGAYERLGVNDRTGLARLLAADALTPA